MKSFKFISLASLVFALTLKQIFTQEVEPELELFLADNPDILNTKPTNKQHQPVDIQVESESTNPATEQTDSAHNSESKIKAELETRLNAIIEEVNSIFDNYLFLNHTTLLNQTELNNLKLYIKNEIAYIKNLVNDGGIIGLNNAPWYTQRLSEVIYWFKFACLNLEALSVSCKDSRLSILKEPLDFVEMQQAKLAILSHLFYLYNPSLRKGPVPMAWTEYTEKSVRSIIFRSLPNRLQSSVISYILCGITQSSKQAYYLSKILSQNFYAEKVILSEEFLAISSAFYKTQKFGELLEVDSFLNKLEEVIDEFAVSKTIQASNKKIGHYLILELLLTKLIKIRSDVIKFHKPNLNFKDDQTKAKLLIQYKLFLENKKFESLFTNTQFCSFFELYCNFLHDFFNNRIQPKVADLKLFEVEVMLENLLKDKQISWLMQQLYKKDPGIAVLDDMKKIIESIRIVINKDLKISEKGFFTGIKDTIFSGNWIDPEKIKGIGTGSSQTILDFMEYAFDRKFENFKEAAFFLLAKTSPILAAGLIYKVLPYLSGDLQEKASKLIGESKFEKTPNSTEIKKTSDCTSVDDNKIFDFISKNPEIFNKLCKVKPELINGLADIVKYKINLANSKTN